MAGEPAVSRDRDLCAACGNQFPADQVCHRCQPAARLSWQQIAVGVGVAVLALILAAVIIIQP